MRIRSEVLMLSVAVLLAGCEFRTKHAARDAEGGSVSINSTDGGSAAMISATDKGVSINTPVFEGKLNLPGFQLGSDHVDLDGMKLFPGSKVTGVNIDAESEHAGEVRIGFTSDAAPEAILQYYRSAARDAGYTFAAPPAGAALSGTKANGKRFALSVAAAAGGASGTIALSGT